MREQLVGRSPKPLGDAFTDAHTGSAPPVLDLRDVSLADPCGSTEVGLGQAVDDPQQAHRRG